MLLSDLFYYKLKIQNFNLKVKSKKEPKHLWIIFKLSRDVYFEIN